MIDWLNDYHKISFLLRERSKKKTVTPSRLKKMTILSTDSLWYVNDVQKTIKKNNSPHRLGLIRWRRSFEKLPRQKRTVRDLISYGPFRSVSSNQDHSYSSIKQMVNLIEQGDYYRTNLSQYWRGVQLIFFSQAIEV